MLDSDGMHRRARSFRAVLLAVAVLAVPGEASAGVGSLTTTPAPDGPPGAVVYHLAYRDTTDASAAVFSMTSRVDTVQACDKDGSCTTLRRTVYTLTDTGGITAGTGCLRVRKTTSVECPVGEFDASARSADDFAGDFGAGADSVTIGLTFAQGVALDGGAGDDALNAGPSRGTVAGGGGNDNLNGGGRADAIVGGTGVDIASYASRTASQPVVVTLDGVANDGGVADSSADDVGQDVENVRGGSGDDVLTGSAAANTLIGASGNDSLDGGAGPDDLRGQAGTDTVSYAKRDLPLAVSLDGAANDGGNPDGAGDNVRSDVENVIGGSGPDFIVGSSSNNVLQGLDGNDSISGRGSNDTIDGGFGADVLRGDGGVDTVTYANRLAAVSVTLDDDGAADGGDLDGPPGARDSVGGDVERLIGGIGDDVLSGNGLANAITGGAGDDAIDVHGDPGVADGVNCGTGSDSVTRDPADTVQANCERVATTPLLGDRVWSDADADGLQDEGEVGVSGVRAELRDSNGQEVGLTTTDADGLYRFEGLPPGTYRVCFAVAPGSGPAGFTTPDAGPDDVDSDANPATGCTAAFAVAPGEAKLTVDAGVVEPILGDRVWSDADADGVQDAGEAGVSGVEVELRDSNGQAIDATITDADGLYRFETLPAGTYRVCFVVPPAAGSVTFTAPDAGPDDVDSDASPTTGCTSAFALAAGEAKLTVDAGLVPPG